MSNGHVPSAEALVVEAHALWRIYYEGAQNEVAALRGLDLEIPKGRYIALKGRSGSGKTTLLNCISGLDQPTRGTVTVMGRDLSKFNEHELTEWRRHSLGLIFQSFGLVPILSAYENIELALRLAKVGGARRRERTRACLDLVGLTKWADHNPQEMSGGQQQRVAIARALANQPPLIIADEPTGELDSTTAREILALFRTIVDSEGVTVLMTSHGFLVDDYADQVLYLKDGVISTEDPALSSVQA